MNNEIKVGDIFKRQTRENYYYVIKVVNINEFREPASTYAVDLYNMEGNLLCDDVQFCSEEFLNKCEKERSK